MKLQAIHQIEMTSVCNLACPYCAHPTMRRERQHMSRENYLAALTVAKRLYEANGHRQALRELNLAGIGESTLHPDFIEFVQLARDFMGPGVDLILATNGVALTEAQAQALCKERVRTWVSLHRPERAAHAVELCRKYGILSGISIDPAMCAVDWAGQVKWHNSAETHLCPWLAQGWCFVFADGRVSTCCYDAQGTDGVIGHITDDAICDAEVKPYSLCKTCHMQKPEAA